MTKLSKPVIIGIDLGTTNSVVCIWDWKNEKPKVVQNKFLKNITPSTVYFDKTTDKILVGQAAVEQANMPDKAGQTAYAVKRVIGREWMDPVVQKSFRFDVEFNIGQGQSEQTQGKPTVQVNHNNSMTDKSAEEIGSYVLGALLQDAQLVLAEELEDIKELNCVISVPAYFGDVQKAATKEAGRLAGLNVLEVVNEPTAAALSYGLDTSLDTTKSDKERTVCIFDLGGGTFDVSIVKIGAKIAGQQQSFQVLAVGGDDKLGGEDFDTALYKYVVGEANKQLEDEGQNYDDIPGAKKRLKQACKECKEMFAAADEYEIDIPTLIPGYDFNITISRAKFVELCTPFFAKCMPHVEQTLQKAHVTKEQIDAVIPVGGSCRILAIQDLIKNHFGAQKVENTAEFDTSIAYGACVSCMTHVCPDESPVKIQDIIPFSVGIKVRKDDGHVLNELIPSMTPRDQANKTADYQTFKDGQDFFDVVLVEGDHDEQPIQECTKIGEFKIKPIQAKPAGQMCVSITISTDKSGVIEVNAKTYDRDAPNVFINTEVFKSNAVDGRLTPEQLKAYQQKVDNEVKELCAQINAAAQQILSHERATNGHKDKANKAIEGAKVVTNIPGLKEALAGLNTIIGKLNGQ